MELKDLFVRKESLLKGIREVKEKRKEVIGIVQTLVKEFNYGRIDKREYDEKLEKALGGKSAEQWVKYYEDYIAYYKYQLKLCDRLIKEDRGRERSGARIKVLKVLIGMVLIGIVVSLLFSFGGVFVDYIGIGEKGVGVLDFGKGVEEGVGDAGVVEVPTLPPSPELGDEEVELGDVGVVEEFEPEVMGGIGKTIQYPAIVGERVKFKTMVDGSFDRVVLPAGVEVKSVKDSVGRDVEFNEDRKKKFFFFGEKRVEVEITERGITGNVVGDGGEESYEIIYELPGPVIEVSESEGVRKRVVIRGRNDLHFQNVLAFSDVDERIGLEEIGKIRIYKIEVVNGEEVRKRVKFSGYDNDEDGLIDKVEWIVPYLSDAVYEIIIYVKEVEHLDSDRNFVSDIYEEVKELDDVWSEKIYNDEYVRVVFMEGLDSDNDITVYARGEGRSVIEVYLVNSNVKVAEFSSISEGKNKVYLSGMEGVSEGFDLKILGDAIEIDYIVDPTVNVYDCVGLQSVGLTDDVLVMNEIDCSGIADFNPIGDCGGDNNCLTGDDNPYTGNFNGQGNKIIGFSTNGINPGLFGYVGPGAVIENIGLEGSVVGPSGASYPGGLVGVLNQGTVRNSYSKASVTGAGSSSQGGFVGLSFQGTIENSYATGTVSGGARSGGLVGEQSGNAVITNSYAIGSVSGSSFVGGLAGYSDGSITNSFATKGGSAGVLVGAGGGTITNSFFNIDESIFYGSSHAVYSGTPNWDFTNIWMESSTDLPILRWEAILVSDCLGLQGIGATIETLSKNYILTGNIDCSGIAFIPLGNCGVDDICGGAGSGDDNPFTGSFNGGKYRISNLRINLPSNWNVGLFGYTDGATIEYLSLLNVDIDGLGSVGGIIGRAKNTVLRYSSAKGIGSIESNGEDNTGGLIGIADTAVTVENSYSEIQILSARKQSGGLIGNMRFGSIINSYAVGSVYTSFTEADIGGLVGYTEGTDITNSFSSGILNAPNSVESTKGGLVGRRDASTPGTYTNNYCFNPSGSQAVGCVGSGNGAGVFEESSANVFYLQTHPVYTGTPGWDFDNVWLELSTDFPIFKWEKTPISLCEELQGIGGATGTLNEDYILTGNIDCSDTVNWNSGLGFAPLGSGVSPFKGTLDGNGFAITGLYINRPLEDYAGLFSYIGYSGCNPNVDCGVVRNLGLERVYIRSKYAGGLVVFSYGSVDNSYVSGSVVGTNYDRVGGLIADNYGNVDSSYSNGTVRGVSNVGGLVGLHRFEANITNSYSIANVNAVEFGGVGGDSVGGLVGFSEGNINNSYAKGDVDGIFALGGLVGYHNGGSITNSYASGNIEGTSDINGGLVGFNKGSIVNSFAIGTVSGDNTYNRIGGLVGQEAVSGTMTNSHYSGGPDNGLGIFESNVKNFYNKNHDVYVNAPVWDFDNIWYERFNGLPILRWDIEDINSCMLLNQANKVYRFVDDIEDDTIVTTCLRIRNENITLDCDGYSIRSDVDTYGVHSNRVNSVIRDCNISLGDGGTGVVLGPGADNATIFNNILISQYYGLYMNGANSSLIKNNLILNNSNRGVYLYKSSNNLIVNNSAINNTGHGFRLDYSPNNQFFNVTASNNTPMGILLNLGSNNSYLENVIANNNSDSGIGIRGSFNNTIKNVVSWGNNYGVLIYFGSGNNTFIDSNFSGNDVNDVRIIDNSLNNIFISSYYDIAKEVVQSGSDLIRKWYYRAFASDFASSDASDFKGTNDGTLMHGAYVDGRIVVLDGVDDYVNIPDVPELRLDDHTLSAWIKVETEAGYWMRIVGKGTADEARSYGLWRQNDGDILFQLFEETTRTICQIFDNDNPATKVLADSKWHHVTATFGASIGKIYIDGKEVYSQTCSYSQLFDNSDPVQIGHSVSTYSFKGEIDEVKIWNDALTPGEVEQEYKYGNYYGSVRDANLISYWNFESPVNGATVNVEDVNTNLEFSLDTDGSGYTLLGNIIDYVNIGGARTDYDLHDISALKGVLTDGHSYDAGIEEDNFKDVFILQPPPVPPEVVYITDINGYLNSVDVPLVDRNLLEDDSIAKTFEFYVWSGNINQLPSGTDVNDGNALLTLRYVTLGPQTCSVGGECPSGVCSNGFCEVIIERKSSDGGNAVSCVHIRDDVAPVGSVGHIGETVRVYSCSVAMFYYDDYGSESFKNWGVKAMVKNLAGQEDSDSNVNNLAQPVRDTFFNQLDASKMIPATGDLSFGSVEIKNNLNRQPNDVVGQYPLQIVNTGNSDVNPIEVTGYDIPGVGDNTKFVRAAWFSVGGVSPCSGTALVHNVQIDSGLLTIVHGPSASSDLRVCLREVQASAIQQDYTTNQVAGTQWIIDTAFLLVAVRIRRKRKKKVKIDSDNLLNIFEEKLKERYGVDVKELLGVKDERVDVPVDIFRGGGAEVLTKYLRENAGLRFNEISKLINRDPRTVGVNYRNAVKKKLKVEFVDGGLRIPIEIFADRKLSVMESVVGFLKKKGLRNNEIALMLGKDERVVGTLLSRVKRKLGEVIE